MLIPWQLWQPLLDNTYLRLYLLRICISPPRRRRRKSKFTRLWPDLVGWILWFYFSKKVFCLMRRESRQGMEESSLFLVVQGEKLYKHSFLGLYLLCVHPKAMVLLLEELHEGVYGSHAGGRSLSHRALTPGY